MRFQRFQLALACWLTCFGSVRAARADDWLVALDEPPPVAAAAGPQLSLIYPQSDLPALVAAGDDIIARVQLMAALTPPPGVQQVGALAGFAAELVGGGLVFESGARHRHRLRVVSVRPDAASTLLYRVRLAVPAYVAPGTYAFVMRTPFGERSASLAVRVVRPGAALQLADCLQPTAADQAELGTLPVDAWICATAAPAPESQSALGQLPQPRLVLPATDSRRALALRVGQELWLRAGAEPTSGFERDVADAGGKLSRVSLSPALLAERLVHLNSQALEGLQVRRSSDAIQIDTRGSPFDREFTVLLPAAARVRAIDLAFTLYPAGDLHLHRVRTVVASLRVPKDRVARLELGASLSDPRFTLSALRVQSGASVRLRVRGAPEDARVAFDYGMGRTAWSSTELRASFAGPLEEPVRALVLPRAGGAQLVRARVLVEPSRPPNCGVSPAPPWRRGPPPWAALLFALMFLLKRRSA